MITFKPLWSLLSKLGIEKSELLKVVSPEVLELIEAESGDVELSDVVDICELLNCRLQDVIKYVPNICN